MVMKYKYLILALMCTLGLASCGSSAPRSLYSWYDYEERAYLYSKKQSAATVQDLVGSYDKLINRQRGQRGMPPPGICAEYGYLLLKRGERERGLALLERETKLYPESERFIRRIINQYRDKIAQ